MSQYFLKPHVFCCRVKDGLVFLDTRSGKYLGIGREDATCAARFIHGLVQDSPNQEVCEHSNDDSVPQILKAIKDKGLITQNHSDGKPCAMSSLEIIDAIEFEGFSGTTHSISFKHIITFIRAFLSVTLKMRLFSFENLVLRLTIKREKRFDAVESAEQEVRALVWIFRRLRMTIYTSHDKCMVDSLILKEFLRLNGIDSTWAIGVSTRPFRAHSWVQRNGLVLNDSLEHIKQYSPILVI